MSKSKSSYRAYLKSKKWDSIRRQALKHHGYKCSSCGKSNVILQVHHRMYPDFWGTETMDMLRIYCKSCHEKYHKNKKALKYKGFKAKRFADSTYPYCAK